MKSVIVIGSGFGGLAAAIRLQAKGYKVLILERREKVGGRAYQLKDQGYTFDMGPSLITVPNLFDELFSIAGKKSNDYFEINKLDPFYKIYFETENNKIVTMNYSGNCEAMKNEIEKFVPGSSKNYDKFFNKIKPVYQIAYKKLGAKSFSSFYDFLKILPDMFRLDAIRPVTSIVKEFFKDDILFKAFSFHPLFLGTNPYNAPGALSFIPYLERDGGVWFAKGGMYSVVLALEKLFKDLGGEVLLNSGVSELIVDQKMHKISGVVLESGQMFEADIIVSNGDVLKTYQMIKTDRKSVKIRKERLEKSKYSMSLFLLYFGLKKTYHDKLAHHTLFLAKEYKKLLDQIYNKNVLPDSLSLYLHIPTISDRAMAPDGCESMYVLVPMPNLLNGFSWSVDIENKVRDWVVETLEVKLGLTDFSKMIEVEHRFTPENFKSDLASYGGAAFATELSLFQSVYFRQHNKADEFTNLYFVGGGTHPGPGVPGVLKSAECTSNLIISELSS